VTNNINVETANEKLTEVFAPWIQQLNIRVTSIGDGEVTLQMPYSDELCRSRGIICGQALMSLIDTCMVFVCYLGMGKYSDCATVSQHTTFMRPAIGTDIVATGKLVKSGRTLIFGEVTLTSVDDPRPVCNGTLTYAVIPDRKQPDNQ